MSKLETHQQSHGYNQPKFENLQRRYEKIKNIGKDTESSYEGASSTVVKMVKFLSSQFEDIAKSGLNPEIEEIRNAIRKADYDMAIDMAESYYQSHYLSSNDGAPKTLFDMVLGQE